MGGFPFGGKLLQARSVSVFKIDDKVEVTGINEAIRALKNIDAEAVKALRAEMKSAILPTAQKIAAKVPTEAPLSGFKHNGRTRWTGAKARVAFTPAKIRKGSDTHPIVSIVMQGKASGAGFDIAEIAGSRNLQFTRPQSKEFTRRGGTRPIRTRQNGQGAALVRGLRFRAKWSWSAGRFGFGYFLEEKKQLENIAEGILTKHAKNFEKKLKRAA